MNFERKLRRKKAKEEWKKNKAACKKKKMSFGDFWRKFNRRGN